jgi:hypothetical protein
MTFSTSLIAHSICALALLPETSAHGGSEADFYNLFTGLGGKVAVEKGIGPKHGSNKGQWRADLVVDFGDFNVIVEVSSHVQRGRCGMVEEQVQVYQTKKYGIRTKVYRYDTHESKVKQALAYAAVADFGKPTVCVVMSNKEFLAFNPNTFKLSTLLNHIRKSGAHPSQEDVRANAWVKRQEAFKLLKKQSVADIGKCNPDTFVRYLRALAFGQTVKAPRALKALAG